MRSHGEFESSCACYGNLRFLNSLADLLAVDIEGNLIRVGSLCQSVEIIQCNAGCISVVHHSLGRNLLLLQHEVVGNVEFLESVDVVDTAIAGNETDIVVTGRDIVDYEG